MRLMMGVLLSLLQAEGGGDSPLSGYRAVRERWKRREALGSTGNTAESSATNECMNASVATRVVTKRSKRCCMLWEGN
jgi:hypothetical protein